MTGREEKEDLRLSKFPFQRVGGRNVDGDVLWHFTLPFLVESVGYRGSIAGFRGFVVGPVIVDVSDRFLGCQFLGRIAGSAEKPCLLPLSNIDGLRASLDSEHTDILSIDRLKRNRDVWARILPKR